MKKSNHVSEQAKATLMVWGIFATIVLTVIVYNLFK